MSAPNMQPPVDVNWVTMVAHGIMKSRGDGLEDFTIVAKNKDYRLHKNLLCQHSPNFKELVKAQFQPAQAYNDSNDSNDSNGTNGPKDLNDTNDSNKPDSSKDLKDTKNPEDTKEAQDPKDLNDPQTPKGPHIDLSTEDPECVSSLIDFLYTSHYCPQLYVIPPTPTHHTPFVLHTEMALLGHKLSIPHLRAKAESCFGITAGQIHPNNPLTPSLVHSLASAAQIAFKADEEKDGMAEIQRLVIEIIVSKDLLTSFEDAWDPLFTCVPFGKKLCVRFQVEVARFKKAREELGRQGGGRQDLLVPQQMVQGGRQMRAVQMPAQTYVPRQGRGVRAMPEKVVGEASPRGRGRLPAKEVVEVVDEDSDHVMRAEAVDLTRKKGHRRSVETVESTQRKRQRRSVETVASTSEQEQDEDENMEQV